MALASGRRTWREGEPALPPAKEHGTKD